MTSETTIVGLDGQPLPLRGQVNLEMERRDTNVQLPLLEITALVVDSLDVVGTEILIGADAIAQSGGVRLRYDNRKRLDGVFFGRAVTAATANAASDPDAHPSRHVKVTRDGDDVILSTQDGEVRWDASAKKWVLSWQWKDGGPPKEPFGSGIGQYARNRLSAAEEHQFGEEVRGWIDNGWLVEHDPATHGDVATVLPLLAKVQEHKSTTPVRPCLDYRLLNERIESHPGADAPVCSETIRKWRQSNDEQHNMLDIKKAYLQVHVDPALLRYQAVVWNGKCYVMTRMGFGLSIAPRFMDIIIRWVTRRWSDVDNFVDDIRAPATDCPAVAAELLSYGLPTKPAEPLPEARVLGLQLSETDNIVLWRRRDGSQLQHEEPLTRREVFKWTGRLTSHYPVCSWLRPACAWLKRHSSEDRHWDEPVTNAIQDCCHELQERVLSSDPAKGEWRVSSTNEGSWTVFCDASDIATGVVLQMDSKVIEDAAWLRAPKDKKHINIAELDATIKGLTLAAEWNLKAVTVATDSKTVVGWLRQTFENASRVRVSGLHKALVLRRLHIIDDLLAVNKLTATVRWVPSDQNPADLLTRVPGKWLARTGTHANESAHVCAASAGTRDYDLVQLTTVEEIRESQLSCPTIESVKADIAAGGTVSHHEFKRISQQLVESDGLLRREVKLPLEGLVSVPVIPEDLVERVLKAGHQTSGHASWNTMYSTLRSKCYFPRMAARCRLHVGECQACQAASRQRGPVPLATRPDIPGRPWSSVQLDTLELGAEKSGSYHCVLVCVDTFTKWVEVRPLRKHDALSVAEAFTFIRCTWGPPEVIRVDNGSEFSNVIVQALFKKFGTRVKTGAVRHPQSQGGVERMNSTLLVLMRKILDNATDWRKELEILLFYYRSRPHSSTGVSPALAMLGWEPKDLVVEKLPGEADDLSAWVSALTNRIARVWDMVEEQLSASDFRQPVEARSAYNIGDPVLLRMSDRRQKLTPPYQGGWVISKVLSPSTVVIENRDHRQKVVNAELIKRAAVDFDAEDSSQGESDNEDAQEQMNYFEMEMVGEDRCPQTPYALRDRLQIPAPARYTS